MPMKMKEYIFDTHGNNILLPADRKLKMSYSSQYVNNILHTMKNKVSAFLANKCKGYGSVP